MQHACGLRTRVHSAATPNATSSLPVLGAASAGIVYTTPHHQSSLRDARLVPSESFVPPKMVLRNIRRDEGSEFAGPAPQTFAGCSNISLLVNDDDDPVSSTLNFTQSVHCSRSTLSQVFSAMPSILKYYMLVY